MSEQDTARAAILAEIAKKTVRYTIPGMESVSVRSAGCNSAGGGDLLMDIYYPSEPTPGDRFPVVVVPFGFPDPQSQIRRYGPVTSWAKLIAASGMAAVIYGASEPAEDVHVVLQHLRENAPSLSLNGQRIGLFSMSGNVPVALSALMRDTSLTCAALLCGYTMDLDGATGVGDDAARFGFANACAGKSVDDLPAGVPMLFIRAGLEQFPGLNEALDKVVARALARNLPLTLVNHPTGVHGFELEEDTEASRAAIQLVLSTLARYLR